MRLDAAVGFSCDAGGRMLLTNEPREVDRRPAPAVWLGRTLLGDELRFGTSVPDDLVAEVRARLAAEPALEWRPKTGQTLRCRPSRPDSQTEFGRCSHVATGLS